MALPGISALQETLGETNRLLASVLAELQHTNSIRLASMAEELKDLNRRLGGGPED